ncbi:hypothetical protein M427DRAFT_191573 [Gonapodya prolifera JEL478]|uniref:Uncharacterized protein n=1 Tax=Gonapodya prolifera (strain JEL478) TaxID=1344416 RepID=A0A139A0M1_GONPJ|nr:hypothetical protein M427DRAFT_191573 [Gonapodya prolifera JEL478]|eukprot:KXS10085.1 hypothetical protein M427DRAFT_191573 [Gonapodya prolifera JEL478]
MFDEEPLSESSEDKSRDHGYEQTEDTVTGTNEVEEPSEDRSKDVEEDSEDDSSEVEEEPEDQSNDIEEGSDGESSEVEEDSEDQSGEVKGDSKDRSRRSNSPSTTEGSKAGANKNDEEHFSDSDESVSGSGDPRESDAVLQSEHTMEEIGYSVNTNLRSLVFGAPNSRNKGSGSLFGGLVTEPEHLATETLLVDVEQTSSMISQVATPRDVRLSLEDEKQLDREVTDILKKDKFFFVHWDRPDLLPRIAF